MTERLTVEIDDWRITQTKTFMNRSQWWIYHRNVLICHHTSLRMTEPDLRAMLRKEMEARGYGREREAGADRPEACDQSAPEADRCAV